MRKPIVAALLAAYGLVLFYLTLFWGPSFRPGVYLPPEGRWNGVMFQTITYFIHKGGPEFIVNIVGNLVAFVPLGFLWPLLRDERTTAWRVALVSAGLSTLIETLQYFTGYRVADVDDVLLNTLGGLLGYLVFLACQFEWERRGRTAKAPRTPS